MSYKNFGKEDSVGQMVDGCPTKISEWQIMQDKCRDDVLQESQNGRSCKTGGGWLSYIKHKITVYVGHTDSGEVVMTNIGRGFFQCFEC